MTKQSFTRFFDVSDSGEREAELYTQKVCIKE